MRFLALLNGWQRIGVVISVLWCIFVIGLASYAYFEVFQDEMRIKECQELKDGTRNIKPEDLLTGIFCDDSPRPKKVNFLEVSAILVLPVVGAWLLIYMIIWITKWVMAGFNSTKKSI